MKPVATLIHSGAPHNSKLLTKYLKHFKKDELSVKKDIIIFDKGHYTYKNYQIGISRYKIVSFIFPKDNFNKTKLDDQLSYLLHVFKKINLEKDYTTI